MAIEFDPKMASISGQSLLEKVNQAGKNQYDSIPDATKKMFNDVDGQQHQANTSIVDLFTGKNRDINEVVSEVAKADMSFKMLVNVRNKLVSAYQETMKMSV